MSTDTKPQRIHDGLSPSSLGLFQGCARKYYNKKIAKLPIDSDASEDSEAFQVGKAFHKCLEDTRHDLDGFTLKACIETCDGFGLSPDYHAPMVFAMLGAYKSVHKKAGLKVLACEMVVDTPAFYGIVDVILEDAAGWWIGDMKTAAQFSKSLIPTLPKHQQLNLYAEHYPIIADVLGLDPYGYRGCRYRLTTKSKLTRRAGEDVASFISRLGNSVSSYDFIIPHALMAPAVAYRTHHVAKTFIDLHKDEADYVPNFGNCMSYFKPCEFWSRCHGQTFTSTDLEVVTSD